MVKKIFFFSLAFIALHGYCINKEDLMKTPALGIYQHYRTGKKYEVVGIARFSEDPNKEFVIYKQLYEGTLEPEGIKLPHGSLWARPKDMFLELVNNEQGTKVPRFKKVE
jgi:hypothetical protein